MSKLLLVLFFICTITTRSYSQELNATIDHEYEFLQGSVKINYRVIPYGGTGRYMYRWSIDGQIDKNFSANDHPSLLYKCIPNKRPEVTVICYVKDKATGKVFTAKKIHPVEFCLSPLH